MKTRQARSRRIDGGFLWRVLASVLLLTSPSAVLLRAEPPPGPVPQEQAQAPSAPRGGVVWTGAPGITETVADIMEREKLAPPIPPGQVRVTKPEFDLKDLPRQPKPSALPLSQWPPAGNDKKATILPYNPQTVGTSFLGTQANESGFVPPDSIGAVGPTQVVVPSNGRIKVFDRSGVLGSLNVTSNTFFSSVLNSSSTSDPRVRYDRLSGRWFLTMINVSTPNRVLIAVSSGSTITNTSSFTFFQFQHDLVGPTPNSDTGGFADYDTLGVDANALYIGVNVFNSTLNALLGTTGFVVRKSDLLAGTLTVTAFRQLTNGFNEGPLTPQGVTNDDATATEGYFIGVDSQVFSQLDMIRISNPGGTPSASSNIVVGGTVPTTDFPIDQPAQGSTHPIDGLDDRLFAAAIHKNKVTGVSTLWTAHNIEVDASGAGTVGGGRNGSRWYEIGNLTTAPAVSQAGTLFDSAASNPMGYWIPSVAMSGQGHMAVGSSRAGANEHAEIAVAGRFASDAPGTTQAATLAQSSSTNYNAQPVTPQRWGDYSVVNVDPNDDMTLWTFQEYCNSNNSWGVRAIQLIAPPPATPVTATPPSVCAGLASVSVTIDATSSAGSGFFDPGPDTGGPGFADRIAASVSGGIVVNSVTFVSPTRVVLNLSTVGAAAGSQTVTVTNPDTQSRTSATGILLVSVPASPVAGNSGPICAGQTLMLTASTVASATYAWTGPNGFTSNLQNPSISNATAAATGTYSVTATVSGCTSAPATTIATVRALPSSTITAPASVCPNSIGIVASVPDAGPGAIYNWTIANGTITAGSGTRSIAFSVTAATPVGLSVTVTDSHGCASNGSASVVVSGACQEMFYALTPCRVIDTRNSTAQDGGPSLLAGADRDFAFQGRCGIPATAKAVSINVVAVTPTTGPGFLTLYPGGTTRPVVSTINYNAGKIRANNAIVTLGTASGDITVHCGQGSGTTDMVIDVNGYFQ